MGPQKTMSVGRVCPGRGKILPCLFRELWRSTISSFARLYKEIKSASTLSWLFSIKILGTVKVLVRALHICLFAVFCFDDNCILLHAQYSTRFDSVIFFILNLSANVMARVKSDAVPVNWAWWKKNCRYGKKKSKFMPNIHWILFPLLCRVWFSAIGNRALFRNFEISKFTHRTDLIALQF